MKKKKYQYKKENLPSQYTREEAEYLGMPGPEEELDEGIEELIEEEFEDSELDEELDEDLELDEELEEEEEEEEENSLKRNKKSLPHKKPAEKEKYYVNPSEFDSEIVKYYDSGIMSDNLAQMISKIANKLSYAPNFINYTYREEMVGDGIIRMFKALVAKKYDIAKGKSASAGPFSYFTRIAFNAFRNRIKREKHMRETHEKYQQELLMFSENYNTVLKNNQIRISKNLNA